MVNDNTKKNLIVTEKIKRKNSYICSKCTADIVVGEKYISVVYNDGFTNKPYGAFHLLCWDSVK